MQAVEGKPESGKVERRGRVPIKEKLNKTEAKFLREHLEPLLGRTLQHIIPQVTLPFPDGTSYRIDFFCVTIEGFVKCYEVKGSYDLNFAWAEQGIERFRRARDLWPGLNFELWRKAKTGKNEKGLEQWVRRM
jgi:hypothetical protein